MTLRITVRVPATAETIWEPRGPETVILDPALPESGGQARSPGPNSILMVLEAGSECGWIAYGADA